MTTPPPIDPFTPEWLARLAQGAFRPSPPVSVGLLQPPAERPSGLGQMLGLLARAGIEQQKRKGANKAAFLSPDFLVGPPQGMSPALWKLLTGGS